MNYELNNYAWGLLAGMAFGALLQRAHVARFHVIINQLRGRDWTLAKVFSSAAAVGAVGLWLIDDPHVAMIQPHVSALGNLLLGGLFFGVGLTILGYCPGTSLVATMEGRSDALFGVIGMFTGACLHALTGPSIMGATAGLGTVGSRTLVDVTGIPAVAWIAVLFLIAIGVGVLDHRFGHLTEEEIEGAPVEAA